MVLDDEQDKLSLTKDDEILWQASPKVESNVIWDNDSSYTSYCRFVLMIGMVGLLYLGKEKGLELILVWSIVLLMLLSLPFYMLSKYQTSTRFYILKDGVFICYLNAYLRKKVAFIPFEKIRKATFLAYSSENEKYGRVDLQLEASVAFNYYEYQTRTYRDYLSFYNIDEIEKVHQIIYLNLIKNE
ncbi:hypothetical protein [Aureispira anguillae]|uniref:Uncharacterized protein n=1 Tax=Aureispira anguillae TaxID=2864201 RepID=A0A915YCI2_9BACT|nr:hypothetical protein [Aureispira anguillae]BDS10528.1 hypothetical protein AsAng_0012360 [Aureispira anguillae]